MVGKLGLVPTTVVGDWCALNIAEDKLLLLYNYYASFSPRTVRFLVMEFGINMRLSAST